MGLFNFDRMKDKTINDAWLESLDEKHNDNKEMEKRKIKAVYSESESESDDDNEGEEGRKPRKKVK